VPVTDTKDIGRKGDIYRLKDRDRGRASPDASDD
jgi:hypothetical protein